MPRQCLVKYCCAFLFTCLASISLAAELTRGPYLQLNTEDSIIIKWRTDSSTDSVVRYGSKPGNLNKSVSTPGTRRNHEVRISGLSANSRYYYSVGTSTEILAGASSDYRFDTSPSIGESKSTRVWLIGDSGTANSNARAVYNAYLDYPGADTTDLWIMLGDNAYNDGTDAQYQRAVFDLYPELLRRTPLWSTLGNHDGHSADSASESGPYYDIFTFPRNAEAGGLASGTEAYYSFDYGNIHFICLDSYETNRSSGGAMMSWLRNDIAATHQKWIIAFWHHPPYTKGSHDSDTERALIDMRRNALPILEDYGVDMVFTGHSHSYERSYLINGHHGSSSTFDNSHLVDGGSGRDDGGGAYTKGDNASDAGTVYTVAGASGKISGGPLNHPAMFTSLNQLGSVVLDISDNRIEAKHLRSDGRVTDYYSLVKGKDESAPLLISAEALGQRQVELTFNESLNQSSAETLRNYSISDDLGISEARLLDNKVTLTTLANLNENTNYTISVSGVRDEAGNQMSTAGLSFRYLNILDATFQNGNENYSGTRDSYVASGNTNGNYGNASELLADGSDGSNGQLVSLVKWDLTSIDPSADVLDAQIILNVFNSSPDSYELYAVTKSWQENSVNWRNIRPDLNRGSRIAGLDATNQGSYTLALNDEGVDLLESWIRGETQNNGVMIVSGGTSDGIDVRSSEYSTVSRRPRLRLSYSKTSNTNRLPVANFSYTTRQTEVQFSDESQDPDGNVTNWRWDFGDGTISDDQNPVYANTSAGSYRVTLSVSDNDGAESTREETIEVGVTTQPKTVSFRHGLNGYTGAEDSYIAEGRRGNNYNGRSYALADGSDGSNGELISLLRWDVSSIPSDAKVVSARITLEIFDRSSGAYNLSTPRKAWSASNATWNSVQPKKNRGEQVASVKPDTSGSYTINLDKTGRSLIESWIRGEVNTGFSIESAGTSNGIDFRTSEYSDTSARPTLSITYE